jgi:hypothetical protein
MTPIFLVHRHIWVCLSYEKPFSSGSCDDNIHWGCMSNSSNVNTLNMKGLHYEFLVKMLSLDASYLNFETM